MAKAPRPSALKPILKILITPALLLTFYAAAPYWADAKLHGWLEDSVRASKKLTLAEQAEEITALSRLRMADVCESTPGAHDNLRAFLDKEGECTRFALFDWALLLSIALGGVLLLVLPTIALLARRAKRSRALLISSYKIGWRISLTVSLSKLLIQTPLLVYAVFEFSVLLAERFYPQLLLAMVIGAGAALFGSIRTLIQGVPMEFGESNACEIERHENPTLWQVIDQTARKLGTEPPKHVIAGFSTSFYVTELSVTHSEGKTLGKTLYLSIPLMRLLSPPDIVSIVGHELGHFEGEDTSLSRRFYPLHLKVAMIQYALARSGGMGAHSFHLLNFFVQRFATVEQEASRVRELAADQRGAAATSARHMAEALVRVIVFSDAHRNAVHAGRASLASAEASLAERDALLKKPGFWDQLLNEKLSHPLDSHPKLSVRLESLGVTLSSGDARGIIQHDPRATAYGSWFTGAEKDIEAIEKSHQAEVKKLGERALVATADYETAEGRELLDRHFPPKEWKVTQKRLIPSLVLMGIFALGFFLPVIFMSDLFGRAFFLALAVPFAAGTYAIYRNHSGAKLTLTAGGLTYTGWKRPVIFKELSAMLAQNVQHQLILTITQKEKLPPLNHFNLLPFLNRKSHRVPTSYLEGGAHPVVNAILIYYHRALPALAKADDEAA